MTDLMQEAPAAPTLSGRIERVSIERETVEGIPNGAWVTHVPTGRRSIAVVVDTPQRGDA